VAAPPIVSGFAGVRPNKRLAIVRVNASAPHTPIDACRDDPCHFPSDQRNNVCGLSAKRHSDSDFIRALSNRIQQASIQTDARQVQRERTEKRRDFGKEPFLRELVLSDLLQRHYSRDLLRRIHVPHRVWQGIREASYAGWRADCKRPGLRTGIFQVLVEQDELLRVADRQPMEKQRIDYAEGCCVCADSNRE
jgi:hypothetical protein